MSGAEQWATNHGDTVEVYEAPDGWRYHVWAGNGEIIEQGSEAYTRRGTAITAAERNHPRVVAE